MNRVAIVYRCANTAAHGRTLDFVDRPARGKCPDCGWYTRPERLVPRCEHGCGQEGLMVVGSPCRLCGGRVDYPNPIAEVIASIADAEHR